MVCHKWVLVAICMLFFRFVMLRYLSVECFIQLLHIIIVFVMGKSQTIYIWLNLQVHSCIIWWLALRVLANVRKPLWICWYYWCLHASDFPLYVYIWWCYLSGIYICDCVWRVHVCFWEKAIRTLIFTHYTSSTDWYY